MAFQYEDLLRRLRTRRPDTTPGSKTKHHAAVAVVLYPAPEDGLRVILIKRAEHAADPWSGQMAFPGGWKDATDATLEHTARRETEEELGLVLAENMLLGRLEDVETERLRDMDLSVAPFVYLAPEILGLQPNEEVAAVVHVGLESLLESHRHAPYFFPPDPHQRAFPSVRVDGHIVWGLTYRVLDDLLRLGGGGLP